MLVLIVDVILLDMSELIAQKFISADITNKVRRVKVFVKLSCCFISIIICISMIVG